MKINRWQIFFKRRFFTEHLWWLLLKFYNWFSVSSRHYVSTKTYQKQPFADVLRKRNSYKFCKISRKTPLVVTVLFSCEFLNFLRVPFLPNIRTITLTFFEYFFPSFRNWIDNLPPFRMRFMVKIITNLHFVPRFKLIFSLKFTSAAKLFFAIK